jgi:hypothetical protein
MYCPVVPLAGALPVTARATTPSATLSAKVKHLFKISLPERSPQANAL